MYASKRNILRFQVKYFVSQIVVANSSMSKWSPVTSGVPQRLVLGLAPFNILVSDMNSV